MARSTAKFTISAEDKTKNAFKSATRGISGLKSQFAGLMGPIAGLAGAAGFVALIKKTVTQGDMFDKMSQRTGVAVETLSRLNYVSKITGTNMDAVEKAMKYLTNQMLDFSRGMGESKQTFEELGISVTDSQGRMHDIIDVVKEAADKISGMDDSTRQAALAMELFGARSGSALIPMLKLGSKGIEELMLNSDRIGETWAKKDTDAAMKFTDSITDLKGAAGGLARIFIMELMPGITGASDSMTEWIAQNREFMQLEIRDKIDDIKGAYDALAEHKETIGTVLGAGVLAAAAPWLAKTSLYLWSIRAVMEVIRSEEKGAPISERFFGRRPKNLLEPWSRDRFNLGELEGFGGGNVRGGKGAGGGFDDDELKLRLPVEVMFLPQVLSVPELTTENLEFGMGEDYWKNYYSEAIKADEDFHIERHGLWLKSMETRTRLDYDGIEQQKELLRLYFDDEYGMMSDQDERKILAREVYLGEIELLERDALTRMADEQKFMLEQQRMNLYYFASEWGGFLYDMSNQAGNTFDNIVDEFKRMLTRMAAQAAVAGIFNVATGGVGGFMGGATSFLTQAFGFRAGGGRVNSGGAYVVGEKGPEIFVPGSSGEVVPNNRLAAGESNVVNDNRQMTIIIRTDEKPSMMDAYRFAELAEEAVDLELIEGFARS